MKKLLVITMILVVSAFAKIQAQMNLQYTSSSNNLHGSSFLALNVDYEDQWTKTCTMTFNLPSGYPNAAYANIQASGYGFYESAMVNGGGSITFTVPKSYSNDISLTWSIDYADGSWENLSNIYPYNNPCSGNGVYSFVW